MVEFLVANGESLLKAAVMLVGAFALLATITPNETDNKIVNFLMKGINLLGANFGNAKNKEE